MGLDIMVVVTHEG